MYIVFGAEYCQACKEVKNKLDSKNIKYIFVDVKKSEVTDTYSLISELKQYFDKSSLSIPQIFKADYIGGSKDLNI